MRQFNVLLKYTVVATITIKTNNNNDYFQYFDSCAKSVCVKECTQKDVMLLFWQRALTWCCLFVSFSVTFGEPNILAVYSSEKLKMWADCSAQLVCFLQRFRVAAVFPCCVSMCWGKFLIVSVGLWDSAASKQTWGGGGGGDGCGGGGAAEKKASIQPQKDKNTHEKIGAFWC